MSEVKKIATRETYGKTLVELGAEMPNLVVLDADLAGATKTGVFKNYVVENISNVTMTNNPVEKDLVFDAALHYKHTFGKYTSSEAPQEVALLVKDSWLKKQFEKSHFNPPVRLRKDRNKLDVVEMKIRLTPDFKTWLFGNLPYVQILKPESLKNEMKALLKKTLEEI